jgi:DNA polymerase-3 subunit alpha
MSIVPLHNHTQYSSLDGLSTTEEIADRIEELGFDACGCTDHGVVMGHYDFYHTLVDRGIKPILGIETYQALTYKNEKHGRLRDKKTGSKVDNFHLILIATSNEGLKNLWRLNTESHKTGFYHSGRVDFDLLEKYNEGLICTSACIAGLMQQALLDNEFVKTPEYYLNQYREIFGDRFYIELSTYPTDVQIGLNKDLCEIANTFGVPLVYANDAHYAKPGQYGLHEALLCVQYKQKISELDKPHHEQALYIMDEEDTRKHLDYLEDRYVDEALANTHAISEMCDVQFPERRWRIPMFVPEGYKTDKEMLVDLVKKGFEKKVVPYPDKDHNEYMDRVRKEMTVIFEANLVDYFLIVWDYVKHAKSEGIFVGPGRGSIGGSLVAFLLGITEVDPIRYGLIFERFYNAGRELSLPDIDIDFSTTGRDKVYQYVVDKYGEDRVAKICNIGKFKGQQAIKDMARVMEVPYRDAETISKIIESAIDAGISWKTWDAMEKATNGQLDPWKEKYPLLFEYAAALYGRMRQIGVHASGVVVGDDPLDETFPLKWNANQSIMTTQWDMDVADDLGYMKMDLLAIMVLDILDETNKILIEEGKEPIDYEALQYQDREEIYSLFDRGLTVGLFQVEDSGTAKSIAKAVKPRNVLDLAAVVALNRPGPLRTGGVEKYMQGRHQGIVDTVHSLFDKATEETYGTFIYQEQIINYFVHLGYSLTEADDIRAMIGKKKTDLMAKEYPRYIERASTYMDASLAEEIWHRIVDFAKYGFNKSHAVEYGIILLYTIYAKYHYPAQFLTAAIRCVTRDGNKEKSVKYIQEAQRMGYEVTIPDINLSKAETTLVGNQIVLGLMNIQGFGHGTAKWIQEHAPYESLEHFVEKVHDPENRLVFKSKSRVPVNEGHIPKLINVGAFDKLNPRDISDNERIEFEEELLKVAISDKSAKLLTRNADKIEKICVPYDMVADSGEYRVAGVIKNVRRTKTKTGSDMLFVKIAQDADELDFAVWANEINRLGWIATNRQAGIFHIKKGVRGSSLIGAECLT